MRQWQQKRFCKNNADGAIKANVCMNQKIYLHNASTTMQTLLGVKNPDAVNANKLIDIL